MAKDLPYFKFFCSEWSDGDITLEDFETQGLFINICAYYWSNECIVSLDKVKKKFKLCSEICFDNLIKSGIVKIIDGNLSINFLNEQKLERASKSMVNRDNGKKGGRPKKPIESEKKPNPLFSESEPKANQKAIREEEIRKENKINCEFYNELLISDSWLEVNAKNNRTTPEKVKKYLNRFYTNLLAQGDKKNNKREFMSHFARWLPIELKKDIDNKPKVTPLL